LLTAFQAKIVGRGVLLDYFSYAQSQGINYAPNEQHLITAAELDACAQAQGVTFRQGDILLVRMGYVDWYERATPEERKNTLSGPTKAVGIKQTQDEVEWLWYFACLLYPPTYEA
jgi:Putative cyclase